mgnify:CR=1 FL=1
MIIGIAGTIGSGKGAVVEYLKQKGFAHYSGSGQLRELLEARGETIDRDAYSRIATEIREHDPIGLAKLLRERMERDNPGNAIMEALHTAGEAEFVRSIGGHILGIDADIPIRYARITKRGSEKDSISFEKFVEQSKREDEGALETAAHNIRAALNVADAIIMNNGTLEELHAQIDDVLEKLTK